MIRISKRAGTEARPNISPVRHVEIAVSIGYETRTGGPTTTSQNFVIAKPGLGVFFIRTSDKARIRHEVTRRPLPNIPDHLAATESTIAGRERAYVCSAETSRIEICMSSSWHIVAPRKPAFAIGAWLDARCHFPLALRW